MRRLSIITCSLNSVEFIEENIKSLAFQSYRNFEHIFIDGYSNDGTIEIIKKYQSENKEQVKLLQYQPQGISHAMNQGIKAAEGEYLVFLHSDDHLKDNNVLRDVAEYLERNDLDWIYGKIEVFDKNGQIGPFPNKKVMQYFKPNRLKRYLLKFYNYIPHQAVFIKKQIFEKFGYFDESLTSAMDPDLWLRISGATKWKFFDRVISRYRIHSGAQSSSEKNIKENQINWRIVQKKYLNNLELIMAQLISSAIRIKNKNYR